MRTLRTIAVGLATLTLLTSTAVATTAQSPAPPDSSLPAAFTGRIDFGDEIRPGTVTTVDGRTETRGSVNKPTIRTMSDPRLDGQVTISFDTDEYPAPGGGSYSLGSGTWRIENTDGAWQGSYNIVETSDYSSVVTTILHGEGAYAGLAAVWEQTLADSGWDIRGVIFPDAPPAPPIAP